MQETQETWVLSLGREDPLAKGMATLSRILAWKISWTEEPGGLQSTGSQTKSDTLSNQQSLWVSNNGATATEQLTHTEWFKAIIFFYSWFCGLGPNHIPGNGEMVSSPQREAARSYCWRTGRMEDISIAIFGKYNVLLAY